LNALYFADPMAVGVEIGLKGASAPTTNRRTVGERFSLLAAHPHPWPVSEVPYRPLGEAYPVTRGPTDTRGSDPPPIPPRWRGSKARQQLGSYDEPGSPGKASYDGRLGGRGDHRWPHWRAPSLVPLQLRGDTSRREQSNDGELGYEYSVAGMPCHRPCCGIYS
jgi:hypothetical protein